MIEGLLAGLISENPLPNTIQTNAPVLQTFHNGEGEEHVLLYRELTEFGEKPR